MRPPLCLIFTVCGQTDNSSVDVSDGWGAVTPPPPPHVLSVLSLQFHLFCVRDCSFFLTLKSLNFIISVCLIYSVQ